MSRQVTHQQIADKLGISRSVVTLALHRTHGARVSTQTRNDVLQAAQELGYRPRNLTTHTIAFLVDAKDLWWGQTTSLLVHAESTLRRHGFRMSIVMVQEDDLAAGKALVTPKDADGAIFTEWHHGNVRNLVAPEVPWVLIADEVDSLGEDVDQVAMDTVRTTARLTEYLCAHGHKRICLLTGNLRVGFHERMQRGVYRGLGQAGLPPDNAVIIANDETASESLDIERLLIHPINRKTAPTAVIAGGPSGAVIVVNQLQRAGLRVPEEISVVSVVDRPLLAALQPAITSTTAAGHSDATAAARRLVERIKNPGMAAQRTLIPGEIIERDSVAGVV
jgi:LacI family transcriptional regulator